MNLHKAALEAPVVILANPGKCECCAFKIRREDQPWGLLKKKTVQMKY